MAHKSLKAGKPAPSSLDQIQELLGPLVSEPGRAAIFLDLDGTLAPIVPRPADVAVPPGISRLVRKLEHICLAVTVVSGRPATEAKRITGNSDLAYIGNHGFETMLPGRAVVLFPDAQPYVARVKKLVEYARSLPEMVDSGIGLEDKNATMSFHYRRASHPDDALSFIKGKFSAKIESLGLVAREGRKVLEVRPPVDIDKGVAVGHLVDRLGAKLMLYAGDDSTDIDAFKEMRKRKRRKGVTAISIGVISEEMPSQLPSYADLLVERVSGVETLLQILAGEEL